MVCQILLLLSTWCEDHVSWKEIIWPTKKLDEGEIKGDIFWSMRPEDKEKEKRRSNVCPAISTASSFKQMADGSRGPSPALAVYHRPRNPSLPAFGHAPAWTCPWRPCAGRRLLRSKVFLRAWHHHHAPGGFPARSLSGKYPQCLYGETLFYFGFAFDKIYWHEFSNFCKVLWVTVTRAPVVLPRI